MPRPDWRYWPTVVVLPLLLAATLFEHYWVWGLLFVYWAGSAVLAGEGFLIQPLYRGETPVLFWLVALMWGGFGVWYVIADLTWRF